MGCIFRGAGMGGVLRAMGLVSMMCGVAACSGGAAIIKPSQSGGSRTDGVVSMSSTVSPFHPFEPDWTVAEEGAEKRCHSWGYQEIPTFAGTREFCRAWDRHGRCIETQVTRYYACQG